MSFRYNSTGIDPDAQFPLLPDGKWFPFRIFEAKDATSKSGHPMVVCKVEPYNVPEYPSEDFTVFHYVTFLPPDSKGAGINVHFRKSIGVPWEGDVDVIAEDWVGKKFMGKVGHDTYQGKKNHKIVEVSPMPKDLDAQLAASKVNSKKDEDEIPF